MSYTLQGSAMNLSDIRRDIAALKQLEVQAIAAGAGRDDAEIAQYDVPVTLEELQAFAEGMGMRPTAHRLWNGLREFDRELERQPRRRDVLESLRIASANVVYMGQLCSPSLLYPHDEGKVMLQSVPNVGVTCVNLLKAFVEHRGLAAGTTPKGWQAPE
ncbi:MAG: hypothetical protein EON60_09230 [Alphaproteobacteria bacterium]|nr:MAG: hypothetical protein EON60_09230 [Alphaproteobacteria bacterium]